jgi:hypothetical protein
MDNVISILYEVFGGVAVGSVIDTVAERFNLMNPSQSPSFADLPKLMIEIAVEFVALGWISKTYISYLKNNGLYDIDLSGLAFTTAVSVTIPNLISNIRKVSAILKKAVANFSFDVPVLSMPQGGSTPTVPALPHLETGIAKDVPTEGTLGRAQEELII